MTSLEASGTAAGGQTAGNQVRLQVRFLGQRRAYWRLLIRGALLLIVTLGIYRFWLTTDARRFLWANTEIDGDMWFREGGLTEIKYWPKRRY